MTAGMARSFLATEENFAVIKDLHSRNLIVPVVGNFAGPKAIRAVGKYVRARGATVGAFYVSNVEQYLSREGGQDEFCASASTLPLDARARSSAASGAALVREAAACRHAGDSAAALAATSARSSATC